MESSKSDVFLRRHYLLRSRSGLDSRSGDSNEWIKHVPQVAPAPLALTEVMVESRAVV